MYKSLYIKQNILRLQKTVTDLKLKGLRSLKREKVDSLCIGRKMQRI